MICTCYERNNRGPCGFYSQSVQCSVYECINCDTVTLFIEAHCECVSVFLCVSDCMCVYPCMWMYVDVCVCACAICITYYILCNEND